MEMLIDLCRKHHHDAIPASGDCTQHGIGPQTDGEVVVMKIARHKGHYVGVFYWILGQAVPVYEHDDDYNFVRLPAELLHRGGPSRTVYVEGPFGPVIGTAWVTRFFSCISTKRGLPQLASGLTYVFLAEATALDRLFPLACWQRVQTDNSGPETPFFPCNVTASTMRHLEQSLTTTWQADGQIADANGLELVRKWLGTQRSSSVILAGRYRPLPVPHPLTCFSWRKREAPLPGETRISRTTRYYSMMIEDE